MVLAVCDMVTLPACRAPYSACPATPTHPPCLLQRARPPLLILTPATLDPPASPSHLPASPTPPRTPLQMTDVDPVARKTPTAELADKLHVEGEPRRLIEATQVRGGQRGCLGVGVAMDCCAVAAAAAPAGLLRLPAAWGRGCTAPPCKGNAGG